MKTTEAELTNLLDEEDARVAMRAISNLIADITELRECLRTLVDEVKCAVVVAQIPYSTCTSTLYSVHPQPAFLASLLLRCERALAEPGAVEK